MAENSVAEVASRGGQAKRGSSDLREIRAGIAGTRASTAATLDAIHHRIVSEWPDAALAGARQAWSSPRRGPVFVVAALLGVSAAFIAIRAVRRSRAAR